MDYSLKLDIHCVLPFVKFKDKDPENRQGKETLKGHRFYNFDVRTDNDRVEFEIQKFNCLGPNATYLVACDSGDPGFVNMEGQTIFVDLSKRGLAKIADI